MQGQSELPVYIQPQIEQHTGSLIDSQSAGHIQIFGGGYNVGCGAPSGGGFFDEGGDCAG